MTDNFEICRIEVRKVKYIQCIFCIIICIRIGGLVSKNAKYKENHWMWDIIIKVFLLLSLAYKEYYYVGVVSLILFYLCLLYMAIYQFKMNTDIVSRTLCIVCVIVFVIIMTTSCLGIV